MQLKLSLKIWISERIAFQIELNINNMSSLETEFSNHQSLAAIYWQIQQLEARSSLIAANQTIIISNSRIE